MLWYVTGNSFKFKSAQIQLSQFNVQIEQKEIDIVEIQSDSVEEIARDKAKKAFEVVKKPLIVNDSAWYIPALNGFPGPYMKYVNQWFAPIDFLHLMEGKTDRTIFLKQVVVYIDEKESEVFEYDQKGRFLDKPSGTHGLSIDPVITFSDDGTSLSEEILKNKIGGKTEIWEEFANWYKKVR